MRIQNDHVEEDLRGWEQELEYNFHAPPSSTCPATAVVLSADSPPESLTETPDQNSAAALTDSQSQGVRRFSPDADD